MAQLVISNGSATNPQSLTLDPYMEVNDGEGMDVANPDFSQRVWGRSLLKAGATLALEQMTEKELIFPLLLGPVGGASGAPMNLSQTLLLIQQINSIITSPGAIATWQPLGATSATTFDVLSGLAAVKYSYRKEEQFWTEVELQLFTEPLGRTAAPRVYAAASGVGPLLMISPYASGGALAIVASTTGYGASGGKYNPNGANGGVSYWGSPSLAGEAPALLQISSRAHRRRLTGRLRQPPCRFSRTQTTPLWSRCTGLMCSTSAARRFTLPRTRSGAPTTRSRGAPPALSAHH